MKSIDIFKIWGEIQSLMGYIHCCGRLHKSRTFILDNVEGYIYRQLDFLENCKNCHNKILQVTRVDHLGVVTTFRRTNKRAEKLFREMKSSILFERKSVYNPLNAVGKSYLSYNEFGIKKRCYSGISRLKIGLAESGKMISEGDFRKILSKSVK